MESGNDIRCGGNQMKRKLKTSVQRAEEYARQVYVDDIPILATPDQGRQLVALCYRDGYLAGYRAAKRAARRG